MQERDTLIAGDEVETTVSFAKFCSIALVEMVKKRFITSGISIEFAG